MPRKSLLLLTAAAVGMVSSASAQTITSIGATWSNQVPGSISIDNSNPDAISVCWPNACSASGNSSYLFERATTPITPGFSPFALGDFTHFNFPIRAPFLTSVDLNFTYAIGGATPSTFSDSWTLSHEETPNVGAAADCPYPSITACSDRVTFALTSGGSPTPFLFGGNFYTVTVLGFGATSSAADLNPFFITQEGLANPTTLWAQIQPVSTVPEPATMTLLATGLVALGASRRRRKS